MLKARYGTNFWTGCKVKSRSVAQLMFCARASSTARSILICSTERFHWAILGSEHRERRFAIIIDEAHSGHGGKTSAALSMALAEGGVTEEGETFEDQINRIMEARKMLSNASYFAFTATPKNKTLEF